MMNEFYVFPPSPNDIYHYGIKRKSGRYPWGSGERPYQSVKSKKIVSSSEASEIAKRAKERKKQRDGPKERLILPDKGNREEAVKDRIKNAIKRAYFVDINSVSLRDRQRLFAMQNRRFMQESLNTHMTHMHIANQHAINQMYMHHF